MTGFGKANGHFNDKKISVEVRSLNSKGLDLNLKLPSSFRDLETPIRKIVTEALLRGKMDLGIYIESQQQQSAGLINEQVANAYFEKLKSMKDFFKFSNRVFAKKVHFFVTVLKISQIKFIF